MKTGENEPTEQPTFFSNSKLSKVGTDYKKYSMLYPRKRLKIVFKNI